MSARRLFNSAASRQNKRRNERFKADFRETSRAILNRERLLNFWTAPAERSGDGAFDSGTQIEDSGFFPKRCRASLAPAVQEAVLRSEAAPTKQHPRHFVKSKIKPPAHSSLSHVVVVGSLNVDLIAQVERLPAAGETVPASGLLRRFGGKGANQAVAAARQGAAVTMIGCLGDDADGAAYRKHLVREGINIRAIGKIPRTPTGTALISVDRQGQNNIVVVAGANARLTAASVRAQAAIIRRAGALLAQLEVPLPAVLEAMRIANVAGVPVVFNPSPLRSDFPWGRVALHTVIANELEAQQIFGLPVGDLIRTATAWRRKLAERRITQLLVTRGAQSTLCLTAEKCFAVPTMRVRPVDTVGAGDAFAGTFTARLAEGIAIEEAVAFANYAGALTTLKPGAQEAMPTYSEMKTYRVSVSRSTLEPFAPDAWSGGNAAPRARTWNT